MKSKIPEDIEIEQGIRYLLENENHFVLSKNNFGVDVFSACMGCDGKLIGKGPTLREALKSAIKYCEKRKKKNAKAK